MAFQDNAFQTNAFQMNREGALPSPRTKTVAASPEAFLPPIVPKVLQLLGVKRAKG